MNAKKILILWDESVDVDCLAHKLYEELLRINEDPDRKCEDLQVFLCKSNEFNRMLEKGDSYDFFVLLPARFMSMKKAMRVFVNDPAVLGLNKPIWGATYSTNLRQNRQGSLLTRVPHIAAQVHAWVRKGTQKGTYPWGPRKDIDKPKKEKLRLNFRLIRECMKGCWPEVGM